MITSPRLTVLTGTRWSATLGKFLPESQGEWGPPWAEPNFSYRFTGLPPVEAYADVIDLARYERG